MEQVGAWPVETRRTRADALRDAIAEAIVRGELTPGQRLDEMSVAQRFSVSRTPVREALKQLATMDLVELRPHRGAVVAGLEATRLAELFEAMEEVEAVCSRLAAGKMSRAERERFEAVFTRVTRRCTVPTTSRPFTPPTWRSTPRSTRAPTTAFWPRPPGYCGASWRRCRAPSSA